MRDIRKRILAWVLTVAMVMGLIPSTAFAESTSNVFMMPREVVQKVASASASLDNVMPAEWNEGKTQLNILSGSDYSKYKITAEAPVDEKISLSSPKITVVDLKGAGAPVVLAGNLYYSSQTPEGGTSYTEVDYLMLSPEGDDFALTAYSAAGEALTGGTLLLAISVQEDVTASIDINAIQLTTKNDTIVYTSDATKILSDKAFSYTVTGKVGDKFNLAELTDFSEFYYGDITDNNLKKCTEVKIQAEGSAYKLYPVVDSAGNIKKTNVYMVYDHLYSFDITLNSIVNEHSEDNGDVYLWKGKEYKYDDGKKRGTITDGSTDVEELENYITLTGRIGDSFTASEVGELIIYATANNNFTCAADTDNDGLPNYYNRGENWYKVCKANASDNGNRETQYEFTDYLKLNTFVDKINNFKIVKDGDSAKVQAVLPAGNQGGKTLYDLSELVLYKTRPSVARNRIRGDHNLYHIQFRVPSNIMIMQDGKTYMGSFKLESATVNTLSYNGTSLLSTKEDGSLNNVVYGDDNFNGHQQESDMLFFGDIPFSNGDLLKSEAMNITISYKVSGTLYANGDEKSDDKIVYDSLEVKDVTLSSAQLAQAYYACPNQRGYDVILDITQAIKTDVEQKSNITVTKIWDDNNNSLGARPDSVTVTLERSTDGENWATFEGNQVTISRPDSSKNTPIWNQKITGIDTFVKDGTSGKSGKILPYQFRIVEETYQPKAGYEAFTYEYSISENGKIIKNKLQLKTDITIQKIWKDAEGKQLTQNIPTQIDFVIYQDKKYYNKGKLTSENGWKTMFTNLPLYKEGSKEKYVYTVCEQDEDGKLVADGEIVELGGKYYTATVTTDNDNKSFQIVNKLEPPVAVSGSKIWDDNNNQDGKRPTSITINLLADGIKKDTKTVSADKDGKWSWSFTNLPKYANGEEIKYTIEEEPVDGYLTAVNGYNVTNTAIKPVSVNLTATKVLTGRDLKANEFTFELKDPTKQDAAAQLIQTETNAANGTVTFAPLVYDYTDAGKTYTYTISEQNGTLGGVNYDDTVYTVTVTISEPDVTGTMTPEVTYALNGSLVDEFVFNNYYTAEGSITFDAVKEVTGNRAEDIAAEEFAFVVLEDNEVVATGTTEAGTDTAKVIFDALTYKITKETTAEEILGEHVYTVKETAGKDSTITYSDAKFTVTVKVEDLGDGTLKASITSITDKDGKEVNALKFQNHYNASGKTAFTADKVLEGNRAKGIQTEEFAFEAVCVSADDNQAGKSYTGYYDADRKQVVFEDMSFDENDIGATYVYKLTEKAGSDTSIEYSEEEFYATVTVSDAGEGFLNTEVQYYNDADCLGELDKVTFTNKYHASGELVLDQVQKVLKNADLTAGRFSFELKDADGKVIGTAVNDADGKAAFEKLSYTEEDIDQEYVYTVSEVNAGEEGISYDGAVYTVTVKVEDGENSDGSLKLTTVISNGTEETDTMTFTNTFEGAVKLTKTSEDGKILAGAEFQLFVDQKDGNDQAYASEASANGLYVTNENGVLEVTKLPAGDYYFIETKAPKGYVISKDADGKPVKYPFSIAAEKEKVNAEVSAVNADGTEGSITVTKRTTMFDGTKMVDVVIRDAVFYVGIFKDAEGKQPYGTDHVKAIRMIDEKTSEQIVFSGLKTGTYYILETDAAGKPIPLNQVQESGDTTFVCQIDGEGTNEVKLDLAADAVEGKVNLNNMYYDFSEQFYREAEISITKNVLRNGQTSTENAKFYAGIFTKEADGTMKLFDVTELKQNGTVTVTVPLGGENGVDPITYYVYETNETGVPVDKATFAYEVSGEGSVNLDAENSSGAITITNAIEDIEETEETEIIEETEEVEETTEAAPKSKDDVNTGDDTPLALYWTLLGASLIVLIGLYSKKRKKNNA